MIFCCVPFGAVVSIWNQLSPRRFALALRDGCVLLAPESGDAVPLLMCGWTSVCSALSRCGMRVR